MEQGPTKELVIQLRAIREELNLSISDVLSMLKEQGTPLSESTVRRVLDQDIENISGFSYEATLMPLSDLLLPKGDTSDSTLSAARIESLIAIIEIKNEEINNLTQQFKETRDNYEREQKKAEEQQAIRCKRCEENMAFLKEQIALKDARMDKKDEWIDRLLVHMEDMLHTNNEK